MTRNLAAPPVPVEYLHDSERRYWPHPPARGRQTDNAFLRFWRHLNRTSADLGCDEVRCGVAWRMWVEACRP